MFNKQQQQQQQQGVCEEENLLALKGTKIVVDNLPNNFVVLINNCIW
jgi:hypothetical protein